MIGDLTYKKDFYTIPRPNPFPGTRPSPLHCSVSTSMDHSFPFPKVYRPYDLGTKNKIYDLAKKDHLQVLHIFVSRAENYYHVSRNWQEMHEFENKMKPLQF